MQNLIHDHGFSNYPKQTWYEPWWIIHHWSKYIYIYTKIKFISFKPYIVYANKMNKLEFFLYKVNRLNMFETFWNYPAVISGLGLWSMAPALCSCVVWWQVSAVPWALKLPSGGPKSLRTGSHGPWKQMINMIWLVVSTLLKNISQLGWWNSQYMEK
jgi:hypothetical protein